MVAESEIRMTHQPHETVWVVLGEFGEYSNRAVFVSGVFKSKEEAEKAVIERSAIHRVHEQWQQRYLNARSQVHHRFTLLAQDMDIEAIDACAKEQAGPEPEHESAERMTIIPVCVGQWYAMGVDSEDIEDK